MEAKSVTSTGKTPQTNPSNFISPTSKTDKDTASKSPANFPAQASKTGAIEKNLVNRNDIVAVGLNKELAKKEVTAFNYNTIQGVKGNKFVTPEFIIGVEGLAKKIGTKPEYLMSVMSFETGGTFNPAKKNSIGATGLIQFIPETAKGLGTTTDKLAKMTSTEQLKYVEKYFDQPAYKGKLSSLEGLYTSVLSGKPRQNKDDVLFRSGTKAYDQNPLDWNRDGKITAAEAVTPVASRMYGGVSAVQQKLVDGGFVPANQVKGFADGSWGKNTSAAISKFQEANKLPVTGLMDDNTGRALLGQSSVNPPVPTIPNILKPGSNGTAVDSLQNDLIDLGFMSKEQKATGAGTFGPRTESALKAFQEKAKLSPTGTFTPETQRAMKDITSALSRTTNVKNEGITKGIQDKLVELGYMTKAQVDTGYGIFGNKTEAAVKSFQAKNGIKQTGMVGELTYRKLFSGNPNRANAEPGDGTGYSLATNGRNYTVNDGILMTDALRPQLQTLADRYAEQTGGSLRITSGYRPPSRQASAMYDLIQNNGTSYVRNLYANKGAVNEILTAYANGGQTSMTRAIERQVDRGVYISSHLRSRALDTSTDANFGVLRDIVRDMGGTIANEGNHFHIQF